MLKKKTAKDTNVPTKGYVEEVIEKFLSEIIVAETQPCNNFQSKELTLGGNPQPHSCPHCDEVRYFCKNCSSDHHAGGWFKCNLKRHLRTSLEDLIERQIQECENMSYIDWIFDDVLKSNERRRGYDTARTEMLNILKSFLPTNEIKK